MANNANKNQIVTKEDLKKLATKAELKKVEKNLRAEILRVEEKVERLENRLDNLENRLENLEESQKRVEMKLDKIMEILDGFVGRVDDLTADNEVGALHTRELRVQVDDHDLPAIAFLRQLQAGKRIKRLETSRPAA